jgi:transketolase
MHDNVKDLAKLVRKDCLKMVYNANASHIGSALSIVDILAVLYVNILKYDCQNPELANRDRFILSKGHACCAVYATLAHVKFFDTDLLLGFAQDDSNFMSHISHKVPGVEFSTGSLGHGLPFGVGKAIVAKRTKQDWRTYVLLSDGELDEGSNWEAIMFAAHFKLDNLVIIVDYNKLQSLCSTEKTIRLEPLVEKFGAFGLHCIEVDGHGLSELSAAFVNASNIKGKPTIIIAHTTKGKGVSFMENRVEWHYKSPSSKQLKLALREVES